MSSKNIFEEFDNLKSELDEKIKKIKALQCEIKDSLQQTKDNKFLLKNIDEMKNNINNLKTQVLTNIENRFKDVIEKANNIKLDELKDLQNKMPNVKKDYPHEDS